jgi:DNA-binding IclR family transcriptional regulator
MELVAKHPSGLSLADISRSLGIPKSSLHPLVMTLSERKYLHYNNREERYYLGESLFVYGNKYINGIDLLEEIKAILLASNQASGETLYFGVLSGLDVLYLAKADLHSKFRVVSDPGNKLPAYSTGYGKALLSQFSRSQIESFYPAGTLASVTANTLKSVGELNDQLDVVRRTGFAYEKGESTDGIQCIGTTIVVDGEVLAGISLAVPQFRYTQEREQFFKQLLIDTKAKLERTIANHKDQWIYSGRQTE